jgi:cell division protein FtsB
VSDNERPEIAAFSELTTLVRHLGDELANFRRRALQAEGRLKVIEATGSPAADALSERVTSLETENRDLKSRLDAARGRARHMLERVRFLRQQQEGGGS